MRGLLLPNKPEYPDSMGFNGTTSVLTFGSPAEMDNLGAQTICSVNMEVGSGEFGVSTIYSKAVDSGISGPTLEIVDNTANPLLWFRSDSSGLAGHPRRQSSTGFLWRNAWQFIACSWDGSLTGTGINFYTGRPGQIPQETTYFSAADGVTALDSDAAQNINIGGINGDRVFNGPMAYTSVHKGKLTPAQLAEISMKGPWAVPGLMLFIVKGQDIGPFRFPVGTSTAIALSTPVTTTFLPLQNRLILVPDSSSATGTAAGSSTVSGVGASLAAATGTSAGASTVTGVPNSIATGTGSAAGAGTATGVGQSIGSATGSAAGSSSAFGVVPLQAILLRRDFKCLLRVSSYAYGSLEAYRAAVWHEPLIVDIPEPSEGLRDEYGIQSGETLEVDIADTALRAVLEAGTLDGAQVLVEWITTSHYSFGEPREDIFARMYTVRRYAYSAGLITLKLDASEDLRFSALYPAKLYNATDWPQMFADHVGRAVPVAVGTAVNIPCPLIHTNAGAGPWKFAVCVSPATVLTVYRDGVIISPSEYTVGTLTSGGYTVVTLSFPVEQIDFSGYLYPIEADVTGLSANAVTELQRLLTAAGVTIDATTFAAGVTYANTNKMFVDFAHTTQRFYSAIIYDLLQVCRASIVRNGAGAYELVQDTPQTVVYSYDERAGDLIEVVEYESADAPATYALAYRPRDNEFEYTISRNAGGISGARELQTAVVRDHEAADRLNDYLAKRVKYSARAKAIIGVDNVRLGQLIAITSDKMWVGTKQFKVNAVTRRVGQCEVDLIQYVSSVYDYVAQTFPADATTGYSPDYSGTPPLAPTALTIVSQAVALNSDGAALANVRVKATPPTLNWKVIRFTITNLVTNEIYQGVGTSNGDGTWGTTIPGLRPGVSHNVVTYAINSFNVEGIVSAAVAFTSQQWASAPATPTGVTLTQGTGKLLRLKWTASPGTNIGSYDIERQVDGGAFSDVGGGNVTTFTDNNVTYGSSYGYRIRVSDRTGLNFSAYTAVQSLVPVVNVGAPDLSAGGVTTPAIGANAVSNLTQTITGVVNLPTINVWVTVGSIVKTTTGGTLLITFDTNIRSGTANAAGAIIDYRMRLLQDGALLEDFSVPLYLTPIDLNGQIIVLVSDTTLLTPVAGTYTFALQLYRTGSAFTDSKSGGCRMSASEFKK